MSTGGSWIDLKLAALMSFTVVRRRKEIGIRAALGADPARILAGIFSRVFAQLALGAALGNLGAIAFEGILEGEMFQGHGAIILPLVAAFSTVVGMLAALRCAKSKAKSIGPFPLCRDRHCR